MFAHPEPQPEQPEQLVQPVAHPEPQPLHPPEQLPEQVSAHPEPHPEQPSQVLSQVPEQLVQAFPQEVLHNPVQEPPHPWDEELTPWDSRVDKLELIVFNSAIKSPFDFDAANVDELIFDKSATELVKSVAAIESPFATSARTDDAFEETEPYHLRLVNSFFTLNFNELKSAAEIDELVVNAIVFFSIVSN